MKRPRDLETFGSASSGKKKPTGHAAISYHKTACATPLLARVKRRKKGSESVDTAARLLEMLGQDLQRPHSGETTYEWRRMGTREIRVCTLKASVEG